MKWSGIMLGIAANQAGSTCSLFLERLHFWEGRPGSGRDCVKVYANTKQITFPYLIGQGLGAAFIKEALLIWSRSTCNRLIWESVKGNGSSGRENILSDIRASKSVEQQEHSIESLGAATSEVCLLHLAVALVSWKRAWRTRWCVWNISGRQKNGHNKCTQPSSEL